MTTPSPMRQQPGNGFAAWRRDVAAIWRELRELRSSQGVLNGGTVTKDGGIKIEGAGSIVSDNGDVGTRLRDGVIEVRESPVEPWAPAESVWIDPIKIDVASKSSTTMSPTDDANGPGKQGDTWYRTDGSDHVLSWWIHDGTDWVPQTVSGTMLAADAVNGKVITGATLQTDAAPNFGVKVTSPGLEAYGLPGQMVDAFSSIQSAFAMTVDATGNIYTGSWTDGSGAGVSTIRKFSSSGAQTLKFDTPGLVQGIAVSSAGNIFVTDFAGYLVRRFNSAGSQTLSFSTTDLPWSISVAPSGEINVLTSTNVGTFAAKVRRFSATGSAITSFPVDATGAGEAIPIALDGAGNVYVGSGAIRKYSPSGTLLQTITGTGYVYGLAVDPSGNIFASSYMDYRIRRFNPAGAPTLDMSNSGMLAAVALDSAGYVYGTDVTNKVVRKFTQSRERTALIDSSSGLVSAARIYVPAGVDADLIETQVVTAKRGTELQVINLADGVDPQDAVNKRQLDAANADTRWVDINLASGFVELGTIYTPQVRKKAGVVYTRGIVKRTSGSIAAGLVQVGTLPTGYGFEPTNAGAYFPTVTATPTVMSRTSVLNSRAVEVNPEAAATYVSLDGGMWVP